MKELSVLTLIAAICLTATMTVGTCFADSVTLSAIEGIWLGELKIPQGELRMALKITGNEDGSFKAVIISIDQGGVEIPVDEVSVDNGIITLKSNGPGIEVVGAVDLNNDTIDAEFRQRGGALPLPLKRVDAMPVSNRPQTPEKPYPYHEEEVTYENTKAGVTLAATLTYPKSGGPFPVVILLTGSGQQNRDGGSDHKPFLILADHLTRQGIAVLRADDRGAGGSTGDFSQSSTRDFAEDALAGVKFLKNRKEIDSRNIGLIGHSEGGMMAPMAAEKSSEVTFIVMMAGPGKPFSNSVLFQMGKHFRASGMSEDDVNLQLSWRKQLYKIVKQDTDYDTAAGQLRELYEGISDEHRKKLNVSEEWLKKETARQLNPWWRGAMAYSPEETLSKLTCPVLAINGAKDTQVEPEENLTSIEKALKSGGNKHYTVKKLEGLNHMFQTCETGSELEYSRIEETIAPVALQTISDWILDLVK